MSSHGFAPGDVVVYHNPYSSDPCQRDNERALKDRVGIVWRVLDGSYPVGVKWTSYCGLDHDPRHLRLLR